MKTTTLDRIWTVTWWLTAAACRARAHLDGSDRAVTATEDADAR